MNTNNVKEFSHQSTTQGVCRGFDPIVPESARLMILGTMPSVSSLEERFYYAHPRNAFWPIMQRFFDQPASTEDEKRHLMLEHDILLWDVLSHCHRNGSLDSAIRHPEANDFSWVFSGHTQLSGVLFNGQAAFNLFKKQVLPYQPVPDTLKQIALPSTSPANARLSFDQKYTHWSKVLNDLLF